MRLVPFVLLSFALLLSACTTVGPAPVTERFQSSEYSPDQHRVTRGDTLFAIAFRYGTTVEQLAAINGIAPPYTIFIDQRLKLKGPVSKKMAAVSASKKTPSTTTVVAPKKQPKSVAVNIVHSDDTWHWPLAEKGRVGASFVAGSSSNKGIDLIAPRGTDVLASRAGVVVYAGAGLPGYGNLLIVKHDARYLSAYAHNERLLVAEGDKVKATQHIADLGNTATSTPKLHFEIRLDGKPVDPLTLIRHP